MEKEKIIHDLAMEIMKKEIQIAYSYNKNPETTELAEQVLNKYLLVRKAMREKLEQKTHALNSNQNEHPKLVPFESPFADNFNTKTR